MLRTAITLHLESPISREAVTVTVSTAPEVFHEKNHFWPRVRLIGCHVEAAYYDRYGRGYFPVFSRKSYREGAVEFAQMLIRAGFSLVK